MNHDAEKVILDTQLTRPYTASGGRTRATARLDRLTLVCSTRRYHPLRLPEGLDAEGRHGEVLLLCVAPSSAHEVSVHMRLPFATIRVLLSDLIGIDAVQAKDPEPYDSAGQETTKEVLEALLAGLQRRL